MNWWIFIGVAIVVVIAAYIHGRACDRLWELSAEDEVEYDETEVRTSRNPRK